MAGLKIHKNPPVFYGSNDGCAMMVGNSADLGMSKAKPEASTATDGKALCFPPTSKD
jgi:hypothetical protein